MRGSTAAPTGTRPMWARAPSRPRPASMPPRLQKTRRPMSTWRRTASATSARCWCRSRPANPCVGESAFATKSGIHASAIAKDPATYEHVAPDSVGNKRKVLVSEQAGKSNILAELERIGINVDKNDPRVGRLLEIVKERETIGYAYEAADASFEMLARRTLGTVPNLSLIPI